MKPNHDHTPSDRPDLAVVEQLARLERKGALFVYVMAIGVLALWLVPGWIPALHLELWATRPVTALSLLGLTLALQYSAPTALAAELRTSLIAAGVVLAANLFVLWRHAGNAAPAAGALGTLGTLASWPTALTLCLSSITIVGMRSVRTLSARLVDGAVLVMATIVLMMLSGFLFSATGWFGDAQTPLPATQPLTLAGLLVMALTIAARRAQYGAHAVLIGIGIGSRVARLLVPYAIALPFVFVFARAWVSERGWLSRAYATGISVTVQAVLFLGAIVWMAIRINRLESDLRHMSLVDDLTKVNNRRGFRLLAEQALRVAHRERLPVKLFYFDLDGLKRINDTLGHDTGSALIRDFAELLRSGFREGDIVGRLGGDEFVVLALDHVDPVETTQRRLEQMAARKIEIEKLPYPLAFSAGAAEVDLERAGGLDAALKLADERMYQVKMARRASR